LYEAERYLQQPDIHPKHHLIRDIEQLHVFKALNQMTRRKEKFFMKTLLNGVFAGVLLCGISLAQGTTPSPTNSTAPQREQNPATAQSTGTNSGQASGAPRISAGSVIPVQLTKSVDAKKLKTGDEVEAKVTQDMKAANGAVVVPKDTKVVGHVTEAQARNKEQKESQIGLAFDHAVMKNGGDIPLPMSIQAIIAPPSSNNNNAGSESSGQPAYGGGGGTPGNGAGRSTGSGMPSRAPSSSTTVPGEGATQASTDPRQPITGNTQGVVGISNLKLSTSANATQGSIVSSEKGNVKLESGTFMLLRVSQ
jgi:hypothetical protein